MRGLIGIALLAALTQVVYGDTPAAPSADAAAPGVRYKKGKDINFEELLIQGQLQRPEISVVTGNVGEGDDGLLRLRENFMDRIAEDVGEEVQ